MTKHVNVSSNINEVIRAVLNSLFLFTKRFCRHKEHQKAQKAQKKHQKAQKCNQTKAQNANKRTKTENALKKTSEWKKVTYSLICIFVFFVHTKKRK